MLIGVAEEGLEGDGIRKRSQGGRVGGGKVLNEVVDAGFRC